MILLGWSLLACKIEPAPEDLDGLAHYFWQHFDDEPELIEEGLLKVHEALDGDLLEEVQDGTISALSQEELELVGYGHRDASALSGVYMANLIHCSLAELESQIWSPDQDELHPGTYTDYDRSFGESTDDFTDGSIDELTWVTSYSVEGFGANYSAELEGVLRRVTLSDSAPWETALLTRGILIEEAWFDDEGDRGMFQDFQFEIYYERAPGEVIHLYPMWREMVYAGDADFSSETVQRFVLDGLADWDADADALCAGGR